MWFCCLVKVTNPVLSIAVLFDSLDTAWPTRTARLFLALARAVEASGTPRRRAVIVCLWPHNEIDHNEMVGTKSGNRHNESSNRFASTDRTTETSTSGNYPSFHGKYDLTDHLHIQSTKLLGKYCLCIRALERCAHRGVRVRCKSEHAYLVEHGGARPKR